MVINIIGIDNGNKMVYGIGNNKLGYMKYIPNKGKWYSISSDQWEQAKSTLSQKDVVKIEDDHKNDGTPEANKTKNIENSEKWGGESNAYCSLSPDCFVVPSGCTRVKATGRRTCCALSVKIL